jgi:hypothetical protein
MGLAWRSCSDRNVPDEVMKLLVIGKSLPVLAVVA